MKTDRSYFQRIIYPIVSIIMVLSFCLHLFTIFQVIATPDISTFGYTEFLINFEGGFIRRGLLGEVLFQLCRNTGLNVVMLISLICICSFICVLIFFFLRFKRNNLNWWLILSPFLCGYLDDFIRKDYLCFMILIAVIYIVSKKGYKSSNIWISTAFGILGLFVHEAFIFFGLPFFMLMILREGKSKVRYIPILLLIVTFLILCGFKGSPMAASKIVDSWNDNFSYISLQHFSGESDTWSNSIDFLSCSLPEAVNFHISKNFYSDEIGWFAILVRIVYFYLSWVLLVNYFKYLSPTRDGGTGCHTVSILYLFSCLCLLPMFTVLSCDYARIYQDAFMATMVVWLLIPEKRILHIFGHRIVNIVMRIDHTMILMRPKWSYGVTILLLLLLTEAQYFFNPLMGLVYSPMGTIIDKGIKVIYML